MTESRILKAARALNAKYQAPNAVAFAKSRKAKSERIRLFWLRVGHFLFKPYPCMGWTDDDLRRWSLIRGAV